MSTDHSGREEGFLVLERMRAADTNSVLNIHGAGSALFWKNYNRWAGPLYVSWLAAGGCTVALRSRLAFPMDVAVAAAAAAFPLETAPVSFIAEMASDFKGALSVQAVVSHAYYGLGCALRVTRKTIETIGCYVPELPVFVIAPNDSSRYQSLRPLFEHGLIFTDGSHSAALVSTESGFDWDYALNVVDQ